MKPEELTLMTADIVTAYVSNNSIEPSGIPYLINSVYAGLHGLGAPAPVIEEKRIPAVSIRSSVKPDHVVCLECGAKAKMLKRHLSTAHGLTEQEYKDHWALPANYSLVAPEYAAVRREIAIKIGLGRKAGK